MREIVAMEVFGTPYMTQAEELPIEERGYWSRIAGADVTTEEYRGATAEEREEWREELNKLNSKNYGEDYSIFQ